MKQKNKREEEYDWMVSYQWTGIPDGERVRNLEKIVDFFEKKNKKVFCSDQFLNFFDLNNMGSEENYNFCLEAQKNTKNILFFINSQKESKGMTLELNFAKKNNQKKILLLNRKFQDLNWVKNFKTGMEKIILFEDGEDFRLERLF